jgi:hypothetical protein
MESRGISISCDNAARGDIPLVRDALELICLVCRVWVNGEHFNSCDLPAHCLAIVAHTEPLGGSCFLSACGLFSIELHANFRWKGHHVKCTAEVEAEIGVWVALILTAGQDIAGFTSACHVVAREMRR